MQSNALLVGNRLLRSVPLNSAPFPSTSSCSAADKGFGVAAAAEVGLAFDSVVGPEQVENNALAGARLWRRHAERLDDDVPRDPLQIFLAHQLGSDAACQIFWTVPHDPDTPAHRVMRHSLPESVLQMVGWDPTFLEFYDYWHGKMSAIETLITRRDHSQVSRVSDTQRAQG